MFTFGNIIFFIVLGAITIFFGLFFAYLSYDKYYSKKPAIKTFLISILIGLVINGLIIGIIGYYNTQTESGKRALKDNRSNLQGGIYREILITAEDGREIFKYEGKVDIESNHEDNYIKFDDENGKRYIIYYGITDTIQIIEKEK